MKKWKFVGAGIGALLIASILIAAVDSRDNVTDGTSAGANLSTGAGNVLLGSYSGYGLTTGRFNILLGDHAGYSLTTQSQKLYITPYYNSTYGIFGDFSTGYFGINTTSPAYPLQVGDFHITDSGGTNQVQPVYSKDVDEPMVATMTNYLFVGKGLSAKRTHTLPAAAAGLIFDFIFDDSDSMRVTANSTYLDSLAYLDTSGGFPGTWTKVTNMAAIAAVAQLKATDSTYWYITDSRGDMALY